MACIVSSLTTTQLTEVYSSQRDNDGKDSDEISSCKVTQKLNDEQVAHNKEHDEGNTENNSKDVRNVLVSSNEESCDQEKLENYETSNITINKSHTTDGIDLSESTKKNELQLDDKKSCDIDNSSNVQMLTKPSSLVDDSIEENNLDEILSKNSSFTGNNCRSSSPKCFKVAKDKSSLKNNTRRIIDSDSEEEIQTNEDDNVPQAVHSIVDTTTKNYQALIDSESEEEKNSNIENDVPDISKKIFENKNTKNYQALIDSDSEEETNKDVENNVSPTSEEISENKNIKKKLIKKRKGSIRAAKDEAMRQIHSETQRLLRETEVSLPYHRPKQRTLQEFLNRKKISADLPKAPSTAVKLKMSSAIISQILAEKEKEAELFYKSSDSEDDVQSFLSTNENVSSIVNEKEKASLTDINHMCTRDSEIKTSTRDFQDNEKEIVQKDFNEVDHQNANLFSLIDNDNLNKPSITLQEITNECNQNLSKSSLPRKLFHTSKNESNDISQVNSKEQKITKEIIEPAITSLIEENCINEENKENNNKITETFNNTKNNKETETLENVNDTSNKPMSANSDNRAEFVQDRNNDKEDECFEIDDASLTSFNDKTRSEVQHNSTEECGTSDGTVQGLPLPKFADETLSDRKILPALMSNSKVTLKGSPGMIIDLTDDVKPNLNRVNTLLDRFFCKHINAKKQNDNTEVSVIHLQNTPNGFLPIKEILPYKAPTDTDNPELNKPGAKLMRLKEDLKLQMTLKRNKEWKQKEMELQAQEEEEINEEEENDDLEKLCYESSDSNSDESEPEENDVCIKDKKRSKCLFADDEAEVTDNEDSSIEDECNESDTDSVKYNKQSTSFKYKKGYMNNDVNDTENDHEDEEIDDGDENEDEDEDKIKNDNVNAFKTRCEDNDWMSENESNILPCQQHAETTKSQVCKTPITKTSMLDLVSPITQLSVLNTTLDSNKKHFLEETECPVDKHEFLSMENTQNDESLEHLSNVKNKTILRKKLFDDTGETIDDEYLMQLCSGKFESTQKTNPDLTSQLNTTEIPQLRTSETELCSVNSNAKLIDIKQSENSKINDKIVQDIKLNLDEDSNSINCSREMEVNAINSKLNLRVVSSDDDDDDDMFLKPKRRPAKKLNLSDSEEEHSQSSDEENNDVENEEEEEEEQYIDYDSEENEVTVTSEKNIRKVAAGFLEEEAELSESEWGSADEDEKDLDKLEFEEGDDEDIDQDKVKDQLEKIHMKQILDEDKRDVRLLKELLFEDGDLHTDGNGRERKFKWRNIDKLGSTEMSQISDENDGWVDVQEDEEEAKWSKLRHERDKFLEERMKHFNKEIEDELYDSQIFKLGLEAVRKIKSTNESQKQDTSLDKVGASEDIEPIMPRNIMDLLNGPNDGKKSQTIYNVIKKRSLLTRGAESLARIASLAKQGDTTAYAVNTRNFVFPHIDQNTDNTPKKQTDTTEDFDSQVKPGKRKMTLNTSLASKKRRK